MRRRHLLFGWRLPVLIVILLVIFQPLDPAVKPQPMPILQSPGWSSPVLVETHPGLDLLPSALQASNGSLWLAWESDRNGLSTGRYDIIYKTYTSGVWSQPSNITSSGQNSSPALAQFSNGTIIVFYASKPANSYEIFYKTYIGKAWSSPAEATFTTLNDTLPSATVTRDGTLYLVWTRINNTCSSCTQTEQLYYKTLKKGVWSLETQLTNDANQNYGASAMVAKDGLVRIVWAKGTGSTVYQLYTKNYNGTTWTPESQIVSSSSTDDHPSMMQDRNGTLWLFWSRLVVLSPTTQYYVIMGKYSYNLGKTWSAEAQLTSTSTNYDSFMPSAVQSTYGVKPIWIFYTSNLNVQDFDIYAQISTGVSPVHDVTIIKFTVSNNLGTPWIYPGGLASVGQTSFETIAVTVSNIGDYVETFTMTLTATNTTSITIGTSKNLVGPGNTMNFYYYWNTSNVRPARYGLSATIAPLPGETLGNMGDNTAFVANQVHIIPLGDVDQDGSVTLTDVALFFYDYGFTPACNCTRWNPYADIRNTGMIDIVDVGVASKNFDTFT